MVFQDILERICLQFISLGTSKQAKQAIKCMFMNTTENQDQVFSKVLDEIKEKLNGDKDKHFLTAIVALGHLAYHLPEKFPVQLKNLVSRKIVKELVMKDVTAARGGEDTWCAFEDLCLETQCKVCTYLFMMLTLFTITLSCLKLMKLLSAKI